MSLQIIAQLEMSFIFLFNGLPRYKGGWRNGNSLQGFACFFFVFFFNCFSHEELLAIFPFISFQVYIDAERPIRLYFYISLTIQCSSLT